MNKFLTIIQLLILIFLCLKVYELKDYMIYLKDSFDSNVWEETRKVCAECPSGYEKWWDDTEGKFVCETK